MEAPVIIPQPEVADYISRNNYREVILCMATMNFVQYFMNIGDDKPTAEWKVSTLSTEVAAYLYAYILGNKQPLIDGINASMLPFMDQAAKDYLTTQLAQ